MEQILIVLMIILAPFSSGYASGYFKRKKTENHYYKAILAICFFILFYFGYNNYLYIENFYSILIVWLPIHDIAYTIGQKLPYRIYIGKTALTDKIIRKLGIWYVETETKFPLLTFLYFLMIFIGLGLNIFIGEL